MANEIEILIKANDQASREIDKVKKSSDELTKSQKALQAVWKAAQTAAIGAGIAFLSQVPALTKQGIAIGKAEKALEGYTGSAMEAERWTRAVEKAAGGALSEFDAIQNASRFAAMGLANTAEEAADLTEIAVTLGASMGKDATTALEDFSLMLANQSIPRLDTFGISGAAVRDRMAELAAETGETDRQMLFLNATMEIGTQKLNQLKDAGFEAVDPVQRLGTLFENAKNKAAEFFANGLVPIIDGALGVRDALADQQDQILKNAASYEEYGDLLDDLRERAGTFGIAVQELTEDEFELEKKQQRVIEAHEKYDRAMQTSRDNIGYLISQGIYPATEAFSEQGGVIGEVNDYLQEYSTRLMFNMVSQNLDAEAALELAERLNLVDEGTKTLIETLPGLTEKYDTNKDGVIDASEATREYWGELLQVNKQIQAMQSKTVYIDVITRQSNVKIGATGEEYEFKQVGGPVSAGGRYVVGEAGREVFVPNSSGVVVPNHVVHNWNLTVNEAGRVVNPVQSFAMMRALAGA